MGDQLKITFNPPTYTNSQTAWLDYGTNRHEVTPAPEAATYGAMMIGAAIGLIAYRRGRNKQTPSAV